MRQVGLIVKAKHVFSKSGVERIHFGFRIGPKPRRTTEDFEPLSIQQVQQLREYLLRTGKRPKAIMVVYRDGEIREEKFYPFGVNEEGATKLVAPLRSGIGSKIHRAIASYLASTHPSHFVVHARSGPSWVISQAREAQLRAMGIELGKKYSTREYHKTISRYVKRRG